MTVCIATMQKDKDGYALITASDRRISLYGGWFSQDGTAVKFTAVHPEWTVMFAGDVSETVPLLEAIAGQMQHVKNNARSEVVRRCRSAYMRERKRMIETQILPDYDIDSFKEFVVLRKSDPAFHFTISKAIRVAEADWELLFAGFDAHGRPHIFTITERGKITYCNIQHFAAIGSGAAAASMYLATYPYRRSMEIGEAVFSTAAAKCFAESASDVGQETIVTVARPGKRAALVIGDVKVGEMAKQWRGLKKIPDGLAANLTTHVRNNMAFAEFWAAAKSAGVVVEE